MSRHHAKRDQEIAQAKRREKRAARQRKSRIKAAVGLFAIVIVGLLVYSALIEPALIQVSQHEVEIPDLPWAFDGMKIVQLTDIHVNIWRQPKNVRKLVRRVNAMSPDLILLTGDYVSATSRNCEPAGEGLTGLRAKYGVYGVLGNHDYWTDADLMTRALRKAGVDVLFDESRKITEGNRHIWIVGTDDVWEGNPDYDAALEGIPEADTCLLMAHNPDAVLSIEGRGVDLVMSGHTHGGMINLPHFGPIFSVTRLGTKYSSGLFDFDGTQLYVSRGVGSGVGSHIRFRCRPEISVLTLRRGEVIGG